MANMLIDDNDNKVTIFQKLNEIKNRHGKHSKQYLDAYKLCVKLGLIKNCHLLLKK